MCDSITDKEFFIPGVPDSELETYYLVLKSLAGSQYSTEATDKRIYSLVASHNGKRFTDTVGMESSHRKGRIILAIFELPTVYITIIEGKPMPEPLTIGKEASIVCFKTTTPNIGRIE